MTEQARAPEAGSRAVIVGAGPAGLTAAWELASLGRRAIVLEQDQVVGGIARTVCHDGYRFDIGGHRFFTKVDVVRRLWEEILGDDLLERPRLSRIFYDGTFFTYPLRPLEALRGLGLVESARVAASYARARLFPIADERTFEEWVVNRFGRRLFEIFFETYTEKVWGMPCSEIGADWAAQRIKNLDLKAAVLNALIGKPTRGGEQITTLIDRFSYPRLGPGMMWERLRRRLEEKGVETLTGRRAIRLVHDAGRVEAVIAHREDGGEERFEGGDFISSMPLGALARALDPPPPPEVLEAADSLRHRDFLIVVLIVDRADVFPDNWIYVHSPEVRLGRIQNFKNWSADMVPGPATTALGLEYFVTQGDALWRASDDELAALGSREAATLGLIAEHEVIDSTVVRMPRAYPVYDGGYRGAVAVVREHLESIANLQTVGRNGQHRYDNQDHAMLTGMLAARNVAGAAHDVWGVNVERSYHEELSPADLTTAEPAVPRRLVPAGDGPSPEAGERLDELLADAFAHYDPVALGVAVGAVCGVGLFLATAILLLQGDDPAGPTLSLLGNYLFGYRVSWGGGLVGLAEASLGGYAVGYLMARAINAVAGQLERGLRRDLELAAIIDPLEGEAR